MKQMVVQAFRSSIWISLALLCLISLPLACMFGTVPLTADVVLSTFWGYLIELAGYTQGATTTSLPSLAGLSLENTRLIILEMRLPRAVLAFVSGMGLAVSGVVFQAVLRNPLADPFTLGISGGAAFGAALTLSLGIPLFLPAPLPHIATLPLAAFAGAALSLFLVLFLARVGGLLRRESLVLAGIVVSSFLGALIALIKSLDEDSAASIVFWIMGSFQGRGWPETDLLFPSIIVGMLPILYYFRELDMLALGDVQAQQLGVPVHRVRFFLLSGASLLAAACVAVAGIVGFVGLVVPHLMRLLLGAAHIHLLPASALCGGLLLLWSDVLACTLPPGAAEMPVGIVTALLGAPFFCFLLSRKARRTEAG